MGDVVQFVPLAERDASANLAEFIRLAKEELTAFGGRAAWDQDRWQQGETVVVFATKTAPFDSYNYTPMAEPFKQFAKAYIRYRYSHKPTKSLQVILQALRCVEAGLLAACRRAEIGMLNVAVMDICAEHCRAFYRSADLQCNTGRQIQAVFDFVREHRLVTSLPPWKTPFKKPTILTEDLGPEGRAHRGRKLPSNATMLAVADLFAQADDKESKYYSSIFVLLMVAPNRISEVLQLSTDCLQWEPDERGDPRMCLRWRAAKGKGPTKKWVVPAMYDVAQEAVRRLFEVGAPAREAARFAFDNPGRFLPHPGCLADPDHDQDRLLMPDEFCAAVGVKLSKGNGRLRDGAPAWSQVKVNKSLSALVSRGTTSYRDLAKYILEDHRGHYWPYIDVERTVNAWDALCLYRVGEFRKDRSVKYFSWRLPGTSDVNDRLGADPELSLFDGRGMKNPDGSSFKLTTNQMRHWLSTMSERARMDDFTLAQWAGRARIADNRHYDHRTAEERLDAVKEILQTQTPSLLERIKHRQPVTYQELGVDRLGTAKATLYGMCVHDYAMAPCQKQRECMTCKEHVCIKGDHVTLERIQLLEAQTELLLQRAQQAHIDGDFGADRWVDNHKWKLSHVRAMRIALEHPEIPDGAILRIPDGHDPSAVRRALMDLGLAELPSIEAVAPKVTPLPLA